MKSLRVDVLGLAFVLIWSSGYVAGALATEVIAPLAVTLWRFLVAALVLAAVAILRGERWPRGRELRAVALVGVPMFAIQFGALYTALAEGMPASTTSLIACSSPLLVAVIGFAARWERLTTAQWSGIGLGLVGLFVTLADRVSRPPSLAAFGWTLLGLAALAVGTIMQSRLRHGAGPTSIASVELATGFAVLAVWAPLRGPISMPLTGQALGSFAWISLVTGVGAPLLLFALIRQRGATRASSYLFVVPAVTALAAWPILGTPIEPTTIAGLVVSGAGLWLASPARTVGGAPARQQTAAAEDARPPLAQRVLARSSASRRAA
ncbi:MAG TPA: DMT family transporter [Jatrophihabitans sp.]|jgi:drug/metabolite transporter (DMT)-like permease|nr:DMT family transporter [Jatrophihabitans sp.]